MAGSAAGSSDLNNSSSSKKKKVTSPTSSPLVTNEKASAADVEGQMNMPNQEAGKRSRKEADAKHYNKKKTKLQHYDEMTIEVEKLKAECENSRKYHKFIDKKTEEVVGIMKENRSSISSLNATIQSQNQHIRLLLANQLDLYKENDQLKKENDQLKKENQDLKNPYTQQQPVDSNLYGQNIPGYSQVVPNDNGGNISQQPPVNSNFPGQGSGTISETMQPEDFDDLQRMLESPSEPRLEY